jgi:hypothetical protein
MPKKIRESKILVAVDRAMYPETSNEKHDAHLVYPGHKLR